MNAVARLLRSMFGATQQGRPRVHLLAAMLMLAAQIALGVHQFQHHINLDADNEDHCALCQIASGLNTGATPPTIAPPAEIVLYTQFVVPQEQALYRIHLSADYQSRAPPISVSI